MIAEILSNQYTPAGALILVLLLLYYWLASGRLYTRRQHDEIVTILKAAAVVSSAQVDKMLSNDDITHAMLSSILKVKESETESREQH